MTTNNTVQSTDQIPLEIMDSVLGEMKQLDDKLKAAAIEDGNPDLKASMAAINKNLRQYPELVHLLTDEQIAPYYQTILKVNEVVLAPAKKKAEKKQDKVQTAADIDSGNLFGL